MSFTAGIGCQTSLKAVFAASISTHSRILLSSLGKMTTGEIKFFSSVWGTFSMVSSYSNRLSSTSTFFSRWKESLHCCWVIGLMSLSTINWTKCLSFSFPKLWRTLSCTSMVFTSLSLTGMFLNVLVGVVCSCNTPLPVISCYIYCYYSNLLRDSIVVIDFPFFLTGY